MPGIYIVDGHAYLYRAFYAIRGLTDSTGNPTNAVYGFTTMLWKIQEEHKPDYLVVAFDSAAPTHRHDEYDQYKAHRPRMPEELAVQIPLVLKVVEGMGIPWFQVEGQEADDIIATLVRLSREEGMETTIVSSDKDLYQLLGPGVRAYDGMKDRIVEAADVEKRFGVVPARFPEVIALMGDQSDNIPGVPGVGEKTAVSLLGEFGTLDKLIENAEKIKRPKLRERIAENVELIELSRRLATLNATVPLNATLEDLRPSPPDVGVLFDIFRRCEFTSLLKRLPQESGVVPHTILRSAAELQDFLATGTQPLTIRCMSAGRDARTSAVVGVALAWDEGPVGYLHGPLASAADVAALLHPVLGDGKIPKHGHHLQRDIKTLARLDLPLRGCSMDTMLASYVLNPNRSNHHLEDLAMTFLGRRKTPFEEAFGKGTNLEQATPEEIAAFAADEVDTIRALGRMLGPRIDDAGLRPLFDDVEIPLIPVLARIETNGVRVDLELLAALEAELEGALHAVERRIHFIAGENFNVNSPKQLGTILFERLKLAPIKKTKTGYSTDVEVLEELAAEHELPREMLEYRSMSKLLNTYVAVLPRLADPVSGRLHTTIHQAATATGRLSSSDPNLQNVPVRGDWGRRIREAFIPEEGMKLLSADYSQIELRLLAHLSGDKVLTKAFNDGADVHRATAAILFGVHPARVTPEERRRAKTVNFGVVYGMSAYGLSKELGIYASEAKAYIDRFFDTHEGVRDYLASLIRDARSKGKVRTLLGRVREIPELRSRNRQTRQMGERLAVNSPIQGSAADLIKVAMIRISGQLEEQGRAARMILQVHDELLFEVPEDELPSVTAMVGEEMEGVAKLAVPLAVNIGTGSNWAEAH